MKIIPAIDIIDGKCVRLSKGDYATKKIYSENPLELAKQFESSGIQFLHLVDLDGAKLRRVVNYKVLEEISTQTSLKVDFGGGINSEENLKIAFESGAFKVTGGSIACKEPQLFTSWLKKYGGSKIILGADCKNRMIATNAWLEHSSIDVLDYIKKYEKLGVEEVVCTDIDKDGMLSGPSIALYKEILQECSVKLIASGGVSTLENLYQLKEIACEGAIIGKAIYEGKVTLKELEKLC